MIRVLIADDAVVIRRMLTKALEAEPDITVVARAENGRQAVELAEKMRPDAIVLDIEMPEMTGIEALTEIRKRWPKLPVVMFSTLTENGASATLDALSRGANDYCTKPSNTSGLFQAMQIVGQELVPRIRALTERVSGPRPLPRVGKRGAEPDPRPRVSTLQPPDSPPKVRAGGVERRIDVVAIACSTGGPNALMDLVPTLSAEFPVPIVIVQHMPPVFTKMLAERLDQRSGIRVEEGIEGRKLEKGVAYVAPGGSHMMLRGPVSGATLGLNQDPPENSCRPAADVLFRSVAGVYGPHALGVVLTGMGKDGLIGSRLMLEQGAQLIAQDEASSVVWGMPGHVSREGLAHAILPLSEIALEITRRLGRHRPAFRPILRAPMRAGASR